MLLGRRLDDSNRCFHAFGSGQCCAIGSSGSNGDVRYAIHTRQSQEKASHDQRHAHRLGRYGRRFHLGDRAQHGNQSLLSGGLIALFYFPSDRSFMVTPFK